MTGQVAPRTGGGYLPSRATACVGAFCICGGNGHDGDPNEGLQTLFSWAEFMAEEPVKPKGRSRKPQPSTLSMFEWAFSLEQREKESVRVGG